MWKNRERQKHKFDSNGSLNTIQSICIERGHLVTDTHTGRILHEDQGRTWGDVVTSQGMPKIANKPLEARKRQGRGGSPTDFRRSTPVLIP